MDFILGVTIGLFGGLTLMQLLMQQTITLAGRVDRAEAPKRYWTTTLAYAAACVGLLPYVL